MNNVERRYLSKDVQWCVLRGHGCDFATPKACIQYDIEGLPQVFEVIPEGAMELGAARKAGQLYLRPIRVTPLEPFEDDLVIIRGAGLRQGTLFFQPPAFPGEGET